MSEVTPPPQTTDVAIERITHRLGRQIFESSNEKIMQAVADVFGLEYKSTELNMDQILGSGTYGTVASLAEDESQCGKSFTDDFIDAVYNLVEELIKIMKIPEKVRPKIFFLSLCDSYQIDRGFRKYVRSCPTIIMERFVMDLAKFFKQGGTLSMEQIRQLLNLLIVTHEHGVAHCDLKPQNILVDKHGNPKLTDFGNSMPIDEETKDVLCTRWFNSMISLLAHGGENQFDANGSRALYMKRLPLSEKDYFSHDVWSMAIIIVQSFFGDYPFMGRNSGHQLQLYVETFMDCNTDSLIQERLGLSSVDEVSALVRKYFREEKCEAFLQQKGVPADYTDLLCAIFGMSDNIEEVVRTFLGEDVEGVAEDVVAASPLVKAAPAAPATRQMNYLAALLGKLDKSQN